LVDAVFLDGFLLVQALEGTVVSLFLFGFEGGKEGEERGEKDASNFWGRRRRRRCEC
jgi:hypothetical protein